MDDFYDANSSASAPKSIRLQPLFQSLINELENSRSRLSKHLDRYHNWLQPNRQKSWSSRLRILIFDLVIRRDIYPTDQRRLLQRIYLIPKASDQEFLDIDEFYQNYMFDNEIRESKKRVINFATWGDKAFENYTKWWFAKGKKFQRGGISHYITQRINEEWFTYFIFKSSEHQDPPKTRHFQGITGAYNGWKRAGWVIAIHHLGKDFFENISENSGISENIVSDIELRFGMEFDVVDSRYHEIMQGVRKFIPTSDPTSEFVIDEICPVCGARDVIQECDQCGYVEPANLALTTYIQKMFNPEQDDSEIKEIKEKKKEKTDSKKILKYLLRKEMSKLPDWYIHLFYDGIEKIMGPLANIFPSDLYASIRRNIRKDIAMIKIAKGASF